MPQYEVRYCDVKFKDGSLTRIEYYHESNVESPSAYRGFLARMGFLHQEYEYWKTVVADSVTMMELHARKWEEKVMNPMQKFAKGTDTRQWFAGSTDALEEMLVMRFGQLPMNVVVIAHIDERKNEVSGEILRGPFAPGRLSKRGMLGASYQEFYHSYRTPPDENGQRFYQLQTSIHDGFSATTQLGTPDPCYPAYESLWKNWAAGRPPIHCFTYGDFGTGKSTFAATWPSPRLIFCFDPVGKDLPYKKARPELGVELDGEPVEASYVVNL